MKTISRPGNPGQKQSVPGTGKNKSNASNPKKPNNDPDQTPTREVENVPVAKPQKTKSKK